MWLKGNKYEWQKFEHSKRVLKAVKQSCKMLSVRMFKCLYVFGLEIFSFAYYKENVIKILSKQKCFVSPGITYSVKLITFLPNHIVLS
jgi:hypothetical protein